MKNMKQILFAALSAFAIGAFAQGTFTVTESLQTMSKGEQPSFTVAIPQANLKEVEEQWKKYTASKSNGNLTLTNGEYLQAGAMNSNISAGRLFIFSRLLATPDEVRVTAWVSENGSLFISKSLNNNQDLAVQKYMRDFAVEQQRSMVGKELKAAQKKQKEMEDELADLIKAEEKSGKKINKDERSITRANDAIATNSGDIKSSSDKISDQKGMVDQTAADKNANKGAQKTLGNLENDKKQLQKRNEGENKDIYDRNKEIREEGRNIAAAQDKQAIKKQEIDKQTQKVAEIQIRLDAIK
jgi:hypothetical protein